MGKYGWIFIFLIGLAAYYSLLSLPLKWFRKKNRFEDRGLGEALFDWLERHPLIAALIVGGVIYASTPNRLGFIEALAAIAFLEMSILWAEVVRMREQLDNLESRAGTDPRRTAGAGAFEMLCERVRELQDRHLKLETRTDTCEKFIGELLSREL
jgi:hypothetical protein